MVYMIRSSAGQFLPTVPQVRPNFFWNLNGLRFGPVRNLSLTVPVGLEAGGAQGSTRVAELEHRLRLTQDELDAAHTELDRLRTQQDFYRQLLGDRATTRDRGTNE